MDFSSLSQLLAVAERICKALDKNTTAPAVALDISNAFYRVWQAGLLHRLKGYGISQEMLGLIQSFLFNVYICY